MKSLKNTHILSLIFSLLFSQIVWSEDKDSLSKFTIQGEVDLKTSEFVSTTLDEINQINQKLEAKIIALQDTLALNLKNKVKLSISLLVQNSPQSANYGIMQLMGEMNHIPLVEYDHPLFLEKNEKFPLFEGAMPLGKYEFKVTAIVGQQLEKWPFVLPEGKWSLEKTIKIDLHQASDKKNIDITLTSDKRTGVPLIICPDETECR